MVFPFDVKPVQVTGTKVTISSNLKIYSTVFRKQPLQNSRQPHGTIDDSVEKMYTEVMLIFAEDERLQPVGRFGMANR